MSTQTIPVQQTYSSHMIEELKKAIKNRSTRALTCLVTILSGGESPLPGGEELLPSILDAFRETVSSEEFSELSFVFIEDLVKLRNLIAADDILNKTSFDILLRSCGFGTDTLEQVLHRLEWCYNLASSRMEQAETRQLQAHEMVTSATAQLVSQRKYGAGSLG